MSVKEDTGSLEEHLRPSGVACIDPEYMAFKKAKILKGVEEARDRTQMTPAHEVWEELGLEH